MRKGNLAKTYRHLNTGERAALAFQHLANDDLLEASRIADERFDSGSVHLKFLNGIDRWSDLAAYWGITHWRLRTLRAEAAVAMQIAIRLEDFGATRQLLSDIETHERRLVAHDNALNAVCEMCGMDPGAIRKVGGVEHFAPTAGARAEAAAEFEAEMKTMLSEFLSPLRKAD